MVIHEASGFLSSIPWFAWVPIVAIICGSLAQMLAQHHRHKERMEMIRQGMNPHAKKSPEPEL